MAYELMAYAIAEWFGERCSNFDADCTCCKAWKQFDELQTAARRMDVLRVVMTESDGLVRKDRTVSVSASSIDYAEIMFDVLEKLHSPNRPRTS
jgi:hypothetical protein